MNANPTPGLTLTFMVFFFFFKYTFYTHLHRTQLLYYLIKQLLQNKLKESNIQEKVERGKTCGGHYMCAGGCEALYHFN